MSLVANNSAFSEFCRQNICGAVTYFDWDPPLLCY